ncbi:MAG: hypothetical protein Q4P31_05050 [Andreesenia angusta]|nr:hypothetical protein [Andreesenia angusta]
MKENYLDRKILDFGYSLLIMICSVFIGSALFLFIDFGIGPWQFPVFSLIGIMIYSYLRSRESEYMDYKRGLIYYIAFMVIVFILSMIVKNIWDPSVDGRWYHSEAIIRLMDGWNPVYSNKGNIGKWSYYYSKATWYLAANTIEFLGDLEKGKLYNLFFEINAFIISIPFFRKFFNTKNYTFPILGAILLFFNPVSWGQRFTFYQDSALGLFLIMIFMIAFFIWKDESGEYKKSNRMVLFCAAAFISNIKFTGLAYCSVFLFIFLILIFMTRNRTEFKSLFKFLLASFLIITIVLGYSPYVKNTIENGNPFYPLIGNGEDSEDIMTPNTPISLRDINYVEKFVKSQYLSPGEYDLTEENIFQKGDLFQLRNKKAYAGPDQRIRGFGLFSFIIMPISILLAIAYCFLESENRKYFISMIIGIAIIGVLSKEIWWARYFSYFWIIPPMMTVGYLSRKDIIPKFFGALLGVTLIANSLHLAANSIEYQIEYSKIAQRELEWLRYEVDKEYWERAINKEHYRQYIRYKTKLPLRGGLNFEDYR